MIIPVLCILLNIGLLSSKCGVMNTQENDNRIIGGSETVQNEFPWQAYIRMGTTIFCGGSVVSVRHILTAAHCVEDNEM